MGEADKKLNPYLDNPRRFAEVFNQGLFQGKSNYRMNLLEISKIENLDSYSDDLKLVFGFIKYQTDKVALQEFISENEGILEHVPKETGEVIQAVSGSNEVLKYVDEQKEEVNMKTAFQEILDDCKTEGEVRKLIQMVCRKLKKQQDCNTIADALEEEASYIQQIIDAASPFAPDYDIDKIYKSLSNK